MKQEIIYQLKSPFRDTFTIKGYRFGQGKKTLAIIGSLRGDEILQTYICSQLVKNLALLEKRNELDPNCEILVIPSANPFSMNTNTRFWAMDHTDINRMFPGYDKGETTQRIAAAIFNALEGYEYGIQLASLYMQGGMVPHVRIVQTGYEDIETAKLFGLPFICLRKPLPFDTTLLNYNWQVWNTKAYSLYGGVNDHIDGTISRTLIGAVMHFMQRIGVVNTNFRTHPDFNSQIIQEEEMVVIKSSVAGLLFRFKSYGDEVHEGDLLAQIIDPCSGEVTSSIHSSTDGVIFFAHTQSLAMSGTPLFRICAM